MAWFEEKHPFTEHIRERINGALARADEDHKRAEEVKNAEYAGPIIDSATDIRKHKEMNAEAAKKLHVAANKELARYLKDLARELENPVFSHFRLLK